MNSASTSHPAGINTGPQINLVNQFAQIPGPSYVNLVILDRVVESVIVGNLQEFNDVNRQSPPDYNKPYPSWHNEISFPPS